MKHIKKINEDFSTKTGAIPNSVGFPGGRKKDREEEEEPETKTGKIPNNVGFPSGKKDSEIYSLKFDAIPEELESEKELDALCKKLKLKTIKFGGMKLEDIDGNEDDEDGQKIESMVITGSKEEILKLMKDVDFYDEDDILKSIEKK